MSQQNGATPNLMSNEVLEGRISPELWPEEIPNVGKFALKTENFDLIQRGQTAQKKVDVEFGTDDMQLLNDLGKLSPDELMDHIKSFQNLAYQLGEEEAKQLDRGKFLRILEISKDDHWT